MPGKITITNRSAWPDWALRILGPWIAKRAGIKWSYTILMRGTNRNIWRGRGGYWMQATTIARRYKPRDGWPHTHREWRFKTVDQQMHFRSRLELLVFLLAHEAHHAVDDARGKVAEQDANDAGMRAVIALRDSWREYWLPALRYEARQARNRQAAAAPSAEKKMLHAQQLLASWQRRQKAAANKVKAYQKKVRYYEGRIAAAKEGK